MRIGGRDEIHQQGYAAEVTQAGPSIKPLLKTDRATLVFEAIGDDKVRVNCASWEDAKVILADEALQVVALGKILHMTRTNRSAEYLNIDPSGLADAGYGPSTK